MKTDYHELAIVHVIGHSSPQDLTLQRPDLLRVWPSPGPENNIYLAMKLNEGKQFDALHQAFSHPSLLLTCRQDQFTTVFSASWCSHSTWEQLTVAYPIGMTLLKTPRSMMML